MATSYYAVYCLVVVGAGFLGLSQPSNDKFLEIKLDRFSQAVLAMTNDTLGVGEMQEYYASLSYQKIKKSIAAEQVANLVRTMFKQQQSALGMIKNRVEQVYRQGDFVNPKDSVQCCNVLNLTDSREFGLPISVKQSCDRVSGIASVIAHSLYGKLDVDFNTNQKIPLKWQYFGSENGILNQFPSSRPSDCSSYDNRFRPWYKASATPNPKDVVIVIKNNPVPSPRPLFEAADIILRTLNPRDRVAVVIYNDGVLDNVIGGCYVTNLSLATPANVNTFQNLLKTAPTPHGGNTMSAALEAAYTYYHMDINYGGSGSTPDRDRAIVILTDFGRVVKDEQQKTMKVLEEYCVNLTMVSVFILYYAQDHIDVEGVLRFYQDIVTSVNLGSEENLIQMNPGGDLRLSITNFYARFASLAQHSAQFKPVFMVPYYDVFGLEQLVMTLSTPCYDKAKLVGVASVDFTVSDIFASAEYFTQGDLSYAFVINRDGLVLLHPLLPFPSTTSAAVYLDISTLEPQPGFESIRESMIRGESGSKELESRAILSRGRSIHHGLHFRSIMSNYSWAPIKDTPFSLCVVVPKDAYDCKYSDENFKPPINANYHMLDLLEEEPNLCRQVAQLATTNYSTVALFPEAFTINHGVEWSSEYEYISETLRNKNDWNTMFKEGILDIVAATAKAEEVWIKLDHIHNNKSHDIVAWRYIASSDGVMRIFPGTQIDTAGRKANQYPWYHNAVADVDSVLISPPHKDYKRSGNNTITLSKAILRNCNISGDPKEKGFKCGVEAVMGMDVADGYVWSLLTEHIPLCRDTVNYRCMLIDSNAYVIAHPNFFTQPHTTLSLHLSAFEPFIMHDMFKRKFIKRVYCNNFQYNSEFTRRPRKQYFYEITDKVKNDTKLQEGSPVLESCVSYMIAPVKGTNTFFIVVDMARRASISRCEPVSCPCDPEQPCSRLPGFCMCPCVEEIPPENYNSCLETFSGLSAHVCPPLTGFQDDSVSMAINEVNDSVKSCYHQNCSKRLTPLECRSSIACKAVTYTYKNGTTTFNCYEVGHPLPQNPEESPAPKQGSGAESALTWQIVSGVLLLIFIVSFVAVIARCTRRKSVIRQRTGRSRVNTASTNMTSVATDSSGENSLQREDSQEQSCSSQEALPAVVSKTGNGTVGSVNTAYGSYVTANENGVSMVMATLGGGVSGGGGGGGGGGRNHVTWDGRAEERRIGGDGERGEGEGDENYLSPPTDRFDQKTVMGSSPGSHGTGGRGSLDPSTAGGIWF